MKPKKKIQVYIEKIQTSIPDPYHLIRLTGAVSVSTSTDTFHVGDYLNEEQVEILCLGEEYEVTVSLREGRK